MKIAKNLGYLERAVRLLLGIAGISWVIAQPEMGWAQVIVAVLSLFLLLNGILSRCYLWHSLGLNSRVSREGRARSSDGWEC